MSCNRTGPVTISDPQDQVTGEFYAVQKRRATNFMQFRNVVRRILKLQSCERFLSPPMKHCWQKRYR